MKTHSRLFLCLLAPIMLAAAAGAQAQSCTNGNNIYHRKQGGFDVSCSQSSCHGNDPRANANGILDSGQQPQGIETALDTVSDMSGVRSGLGLTTSDIADISLYIWYRAANQGCPAATPNVGASPGALSFGSVTVGSSSSPQTVTLTNTGGAAATGFAVGPVPAGYSRTTTCTTSLAAGGSCTVTVTFSPTAAQAYGGSILITGSGGTSISVTLSGTGGAAAASNVNASTSALSFGSVTVGQTSAVQTITVSNSGGAAATNMSYPAAPAKFNKSGTCAGATLNAGASCTIVFSYSPTAVGADNTTYTFTGGGKTFPVALSGTGASSGPAPVGQLSMTTSVTMPTTAVGSTSAPQTVTVSNVGTASVTVSSITSSNGTEFTVYGSSCNNVGAGASCTFNIVFTPQAVGARSASVSVASNGTGSPQAILVNGTATAGSGGGPVTPATAMAVEYYHAAFDHYFITAIADEITKLDNGTFVGWARTAKQFKVYIGTGSALSGVCRFFSTSFDPRSSHFYTADAGECTVVKANKDWMFEDTVFWLPTPAVTGSCAAGHIPVYRLYNNGKDGAPNHRFTTEMVVRDDMIQNKKWIPEGHGIGVTMCSPQ